MTEDIRFLVFVTMTMIKSINEEILTNSNYLFEYEIKKNDFNRQIKICRRIVDVLFLLNYSMDKYERFSLE